ncbi:hypothetical protein PV-S19_0343 [Pacmanvirus S19]|nr:hypothetical protein PV-S19_0343 [Pacmanvirus S19]
MKLFAEWSSVTYSGVKGTCIFNIEKIDDKLKVGCAFGYDTDSKFRSGSLKDYEMQCITFDQRVNIQTETDMVSQLIITLVFDKPIMTGFYASIQPIDCGVIKLSGNKSQWKAAFNML